jgi:hypothetical protein
MELIDRNIKDGMVTSSWLDHEGNLHVDYKQDVTFAAEAAQTARNDPENWKRGVKRGMAHVVHLEPGIIMQLRGHGVDAFTAPVKDIVAALHKHDLMRLCDASGKRIV